MRARKLVIGLGLLLAAATSVPVMAQAQPASSGGSAPPYPAACSPTSVAQTESERAHKVYESGKVQYDDKNYDAAIAQFRDAYKRDCAKHDLLIIISRAYELKGDKVEALRALEIYLERVPNSPDAQTYKTGIESLKRSIADAAKTAPPPSTATAPVNPPPSGEMREHTIPPWIAIGLGGAAVIVGVVIIVATPKLPAGCDAGSKKCAHLMPETPEQFADRQSQAGASQSQPTVGGVVAGIGGAVLVAGLLWHFLEPTGPAEKTAKTPKLTPNVGSGYAGLSLGGSF